MAARRRPTAPVDALDRRIDWTDASARATAGLTRWVLGPGLLSLHTLAFVVVGLWMVFANILTDPADLTFREPLLRWGIVLAGHAAAVAIGWTIWRVAHPPAARPAYRPIPRTALAAGGPDARAGQPAWHPNGTTNGHVPNGAMNGHMTSGASPNGAMNGHGPRPTGAWPEPTRTVVTSRRVTTLVVATARDGFASARRRYRRDARPQPNGTYQPDANGAHPGQPWAHAGGPPTQGPNGNLPLTDEVHPAWAADGQPAGGWSAAAMRDEVLSVTQVGPAGGDGEQLGTDPVRSWLDGYLDGQGGEREARWTWVEAAASTWLARGEAPEPALSASAEAPASEDDRILEVDARPTARGALEADSGPSASADVGEPPSAGPGAGASPG